MADGPANLRATDRTLPHVRYLIDSTFVSMSYLKRKERNKVLVKNNLLETKANKAIRVNIEFNLSAAMCDHKTRKSSN